MSDDSSASSSPKAQKGAASAARTYPYRFGEVGVMMGLLDREKVREGLNLQKTRKQDGKGPLIGEVMVERGWITPRQVAAILVAQKRYRSEAQQQGTPAPAPAPAAEKPATNPPAPAKQRQKLGEFELIRKLGEGAMGQVFEAYSPQQGRNVALKVLPRNLAQDQEFVERFKREIKLMGTLHNPHIVELFDAGVAGGYYFISMEFVDGETLELRLKRDGKMPEAEALRIAREMSLGLAHAHAKGVVHRDVKPENVMLDKKGTVKVMDFGLAKPTEDKQHLTAAGFSIGTPFYISPEQALGKEKIDHRADLYGIGATLFHLLTGRVPFQHQNSTQVMVMHVQNQAPDPRTVNPAVSRGASQLVLKLMEKEPEKRYADGGALAEAIQKILDGAGQETEAIAAVAEPPRTKTKRLKEDPAAAAAPAPAKKGFFAWLKGLFGG
ncbi:MAG: serine/threonine protein kinase [Planctomycetota bacterium]|nr:serine/threonine protein kinase [Planctomycetota bacterium]